jgi:segregation and condensation protein B
MSLKAKLEAVIYAAEEPVTLNQLAALFAADALEWKAAQEAAAAEQTAEVAGVAPGVSEPLPLLAEGLEYLGLSDMPSGEDTDGGEGVQPPPRGEVVDSVAPTESGAGSEARSEARPETGEPATEGVVSISEGEQYPVIVMKDAAPAEESAATETASAADAEAESKRQARQRDRDVKAVLRHVLDELIAGSAADGRGVEIREIAGGYRMATKPECHDAVRLFVKSLKPPLKLSLPALETLAVIAYKQPVTAPEVNEIRGVESAGVLGSLLARKLIATAGRKQVIGRPILYKTTREFLLRFGLKDVTELPSMEEFEKMAATEFEMEPEAVEADRAASEAESGIESEVDENGKAPLESNSPSGEELASAADNLTVAEEPATTSAVDALQPDAAGDALAVPAASAAEPTPTEAVPAAPESTAQAETEAVSHAEKEEDR